jgi:hypothetical protein
MRPVRGIGYQLLIPVREFVHAETAAS